MNHSTVVIYKSTREHLRKLRRSKSRSKSKSKSKKRSREKSKSKSKSSIFNLNNMKLRSKNNKKPKSNKSNKKKKIKSYANINNIGNDSSDDDDTRSHTNYSHTSSRPLSSRSAKRLNALNNIINENPLSMTSNTNKSNPFSRNRVNYNFDPNNSSNHLSQNQLQSISNQNRAPDISQTGQSRSSRSSFRSSKKTKSKSKSNKKKKKNITLNNDELDDDDTTILTGTSSTTSQSKSSSRTFRRKRRHRYHEVGTGLLTQQHSKSNTHSRIEIISKDSTNQWRCEQCNYFPNPPSDPHCYKCGAMKQMHHHYSLQEFSSKPRKRTVSSTGTTSSSPILAPGSAQPTPHTRTSRFESTATSSQTNHMHHIIHSDASDNEQNDDDNSSSSDVSDSDSDSTSSNDDDIDSSSTEEQSSNDASDGKAIIVEDYRSKTSKSNSRHVIDDVFDDGNTDNLLNASVALPQNINNKKKKMNDDDDTDSLASDGDVLVTNFPNSHTPKQRMSRKLSNYFIQRIIKSDTSNKNVIKTPKIKEWDMFLFYLGFKRFILAIGYFILTMEELMVLKYVRWWLPLPLILCVVFSLLILVDLNKKFNGVLSLIKYNTFWRSLFFILYYVMNIMIIIAPPMSVLIASSLVYDYRDIEDRDKTWYRLMWIFFIISIVSMIFIDNVIVHDDTDDRYRVETYKLALVKDEEYILNNQCIWYKQPRKEWGKLDKRIKRKRLKKIEENNSGGQITENPNKKNTKSFFTRIFPANQQAISQQDDDTNDEDTNEDDTNEDDTTDDDTTPSAHPGHSNVNIGIMNDGTNNIGNRNINPFDEDFDDDDDNDLDDDRQSMSNIINSNDNSFFQRCCHKPFSPTQWILTCSFFISLQFCVVFAILETMEIEKYDQTVPN